MPVRHQLYALHNCFLAASSVSLSQQSLQHLLDWPRCFLHSRNNVSLCRSFRCLVSLVPRNRFYIRHFAFSVDLNRNCSVAVQIPHSSLLEAGGLEGDVLRQTKVLLMDVTHHAPNTYSKVVPAEEDCNRFMMDLSAG